MDRAAEEGEQSDVAEGSPGPLGGVAGAVAEAVDNPASYPEPAGSPRQYWVGEAAHGEQEVELGKVLKSVLVSSLDTIEDSTVLTIHLWVLNSIFFTGL